MCETTWSTRRQAHALYCLCCLQAFVVAAQCEEGLPKSTAAHTTSERKHQPGERSLPKPSMRTTRVIGSALSTYWMRIQLDRLILSTERLVGLLYIIDFHSFNNIWQSPGIAARPANDMSLSVGPFFGELLGPLLVALYFRTQGGAWRQ